ncbi:phage major capsid protein [Salinisphaera sp.]|uniref:phage major capsid protein n=1 Tax=Salinisphaera sp. TaxID=1914330 RepID=UPI000C3F8FE6|nr:phage major capsid protein [Salinisphaera sp.]MAS09918.1 phage major capsid protein [Salinisphaera sp.]
MAAPNLSEIVTTTLKNRRRKLADNVLEHNPLLRYLNRSGNVDTADGGESLVEELEYAENSTFKYYSGYEALDITPSEVFTAAEFDWKQAAVSVSISGLEMRKNSGRERMIRLLERRIKNAEKTMKNRMSKGIYSDGSADGGKQIGGLQLLVADDPTTGVVGGIDRSAHEFWRNVAFDANADGGAPADETNIQGYMQQVWLDLVRGDDKPSIIMADPLYFSHYWNSLLEIQRITGAEDGESGFESLTFRGPGGSARVYHDHDAPANHMYFLDTDYIFWRPHRDANMTPLETRNSINQDAMVRPLIWMGNMTLSNASQQGVLFE